ncbi:hypothetical protein JCM19237_5622 [Photobacterium aphoticum]|uniref:Uncharacterized protein n=1 Tax=Photobacterium aphoticum TaxID=754436 RepID=A0A090QLM5_9GAMM|nr:hypothetical protein JCM19237_5622 [Photobacterium aphoticum]
MVAAMMSLSLKKDDKRFMDPAWENEAFYSYINSLICFLAIR